MKVWKAAIHSTVYISSKSTGKEKSNFVNGEEHLHQSWLAYSQTAVSWLTGQGGSQAPVPDVSGRPRIPELAPASDMVTSHQWSGLLRLLSRSPHLTNKGSDVAEFAFLHLFSISWESQPLMMLWKSISLAVLPSVGCVTLVPPTSDERIQSVLKLYRGPCTGLTALRLKHRTICHGIH